MTDKIKYFLDAWEMNGVGRTVATVQDSPGTVVTITVDDLRSLLSASIADTAGAKPDYINDLPTPDKLVCGDLNTPDAERDLAEICKRFGWKRNKHALVDQDGVFRMRTADALRIYALHFPPAPSVASKPVAYLYEHATYPADYKRFVSFERTDHSKDFVCRPLVCAPLVSDAAGASEDARDAARYRAKRAFAVSMGVTENNDDYDKDSDSMVAAIAAIAKGVR